MDGDIARTRVRSSDSLGRAVDEDRLNSQPVWTQHSNVVVKGKATSLICMLAWWITVTAHRHLQSEASVNRQSMVEWLGLMQKSLVSSATSQSRTGHQSYVQGWCHGLMRELTLRIWEYSLQLRQCWQKRQHRAVGGPSSWSMAFVLKQFLNASQTKREEWVNQ